MRRYRSISQHAAVRRRALATAATIGVLSAVAAPQALAQSDWPAKPVRIGVPEYAGGLADVVRTPRFATALGLLEEARMQRLRGRKVAEQSGSFKETLRRMKEWFLGNF